MPHIGQLRPDSGLDFQGKILKAFQVVPSSLESGINHVRCFERPLYRNVHWSEPARPIDSFIAQLKAQGPSRTCNESTQEARRANGVVS